MFFDLNLLDIITNTTKLQPSVMANVTKKPEQYEGPAKGIVKGSYQMEESRPVYFVKLF